MPTPFEQWRLQQLTGQNPSPDDGQDRPLLPPNLPFSTPGAFRAVPPNMANLLLNPAQGQPLQGGDGDVLPPAQPLPDFFQRMTQPTNSQPSSAIGNILAPGQQPPPAIPIAELAANNPFVSPTAPSPQGSGPIGGMRGGQGGPLSSQPPPPPGPAQLSIWNGGQGSGVDANGRTTAPATDSPSWPAGFSFGTPQSAAPADPQVAMADMLMRRLRENLPGVSSASPEEWNRQMAVRNAALTQGAQSIYGQGLSPLLNNQQHLGDLNLRSLQALGLPGANGQPGTPGSIQNAAEQSQAQSPYVRAREAAMASMLARGLSSRQVQQELQTLGYGPSVLPTGQSAQQRVLPQNSDQHFTDNPLNQAIETLRRRNPQNGSVIGDELNPFGNDTRDQYFGALTNVFSATPQNQMTPDFIQQVRQRFGEPAFQSWWQSNLPLMSPTSALPLSRMTPQQQAHSMARLRLAQVSGQQPPRIGNIFGSGSPVNDQTAGGLNGPLQYLRAISGLSPQ